MLLSATTASAQNLVAPEVVQLENLQVEGDIANSICWQREQSLPPLLQHQSARWLHHARGEQKLSSVQCQHALEDAGRKGFPNTDLHTRLDRQI